MTEWFHSTYRTFENAAIWTMFRHIGNSPLGLLFVILFVVFCVIMALWKRGR